MQPVIGHLMNVLEAQRETALEVEVIPHTLLAEQLAGLQILQQGEAALSTWTVQLSLTLLYP